MRPRLFAAAALAIALPAAAGEETDESLRAKAFETKGRKDYAACAATMDQILKRGESSIGALYFGAGCYALTGQKDKAFSALERAVGQPVDRNSFFNFKRLELDPRLDLGSLRDDPRWQPLVAKTRERIRLFMASESSEVFQLYVEDQADRWRTPLDRGWLVPRDLLRREKARELLRTGRLRDAEDYSEAAMIFQHGEDEKDFQLAHELALKAHALEPESPAYLWIVPATLDRWLWSRCQPQIYGTQFQVTDGRYTIEPIDAGLIDDAERERWNVPPLSAARERAERLTETLRAGAAKEEGAKKPDR